jgi:hypothetical protein
VLCTARKIWSAPWQDLDSLSSPLQVCVILFQQLHYLDLAGIGRWASGSSEAASLRRYASASH